MEGHRSPCSCGTCYKCLRQRLTHFTYLCLSCKNNNFDVIHVDFPRLNFRTIPRSRYRDFIRPSIGPRSYTHVWELLRKGIFCVTLSWRNNPDPVVSAPFSVCLCPPPSPFNAAVDSIHGRSSSTGGERRKQDHDNDFRDQLLFYMIIMITLLLLCI